jgi:hypothetical protein
MIKGYKGFGKDMKCRGFQFQVGGEYEESDAIACEKGFHFCEFPFDVFNYYPPSDSRYAEVEGDGKISKHDDDSKVACTKLRVGAEIGLSGLISAGVKFILEKVDWSNKKESNTGDCSAATNTGNYSAATNTGARSAATNTGDCSAATNTGARSAATNTGNYSAATVKGKESVAMALGYQSKARGALGCWIVLAEWAWDDKGDWHIIDVQCAKVDGEKIKADTFYRLENGKFVECEDEEE